MMAGTLAIALIACGLAGCGIGRVVTAPVRYVFHEPEPTAANVSDVENPGQPVAAPSPTPAKRTASSKRAASNPSPRIGATKPKASPSAEMQFPVAKPVPGRPGLVFNQFNPNGGYIDVSGYAPGSTV